ncbi:MAG: ABC transporter permease [Chlorobi bacterium]|nr:ABC transporter permease [Chlorobiota bacterium]
MTSSLIVYTRIVVTHLRSRRRQTILSALGITLGIAFYIAMVSFMTGVNQFLEDIMLSATPHIRLYNDVVLDSVSIAQRWFGTSAFVFLHHPKAAQRTRAIRNAPEIVGILRRQQQEVFGVSPRVTAQIYYTQGITEIPGTLVGVDLIEENKLFAVSSKITEGSLRNVLTTDDGIMIGGGLADKLNVHVGDRIPITLSSGVQRLMTIAAVMRFGIAQIDNVQAYTTLKTVQRLLGKDQRYITDIYIKLHNRNDAPRLAGLYTQLFDCTAEDWQTFNATILVSFTIRNILTYAVSISMLTVAGFGIYNILTMMILEKLKDIAILKATGFSPRDIRMIVLGQSLVLGIAGGAVGMLLGLLMSFGISRVPFRNEFLPGMEYLPVDFSPVHYVVAVTFALLAATIAGIFPARRAARIDPVAILRG